METYIWTIIIILSFENTLKLICLTKGKTPERTLGTMALDVFIGTCLVIWGVVALLS